MPHYYKKMVKNLHNFETMLKDLEVSPAFHILDFMSYFLWIGMINTSCLYSDF